MSSLIRRRVISTALAAMMVVVAAAVESSMPDTVRLENVNIVALKTNSSATTTIDSQEIEQMQVVAPKGTSQIAPNLYMPDYGSRMTSSIYVRGTGTRIDQPVVGLYIDNVPILNKDCYDFDLPDLDNARVMLGPQSTLFGRNTMSGIISLSTLSPMNYQGLQFTASYASFNTLRASMGVYNRRSDLLGMSVVGYFTHTDGQYRNAYNNSHCGLENQGSIRWRTEWRPSESLSVGNNFSTVLSRTSGYPYESLDTRQINYNDTCFYRRTSIIDGISVKWLAPKFVVSSMTSVQYLDDNMTLDQDFTPMPYFTLTQKRHEFTVTEDAVIKGTTGRYTWLGGLFSFYRNTD
ncbi:MAG: TonB-dependent receptor plug domain-containing protein, partial [Muribaculaceae bacterium]|nr:TonB-dependent receptor plug domain-containing protein [Muribaculaceae bacterium]